MIHVKIKGSKSKFNPNKCGFTKTNIGFLGHIVNRKRTQLDQWKLKTIAKFFVFASITNFQAFLDLTNYTNYVKGYSHIIVLFLKLTKKDSMFLWTPHCQNAFNVLKNALIKAPIFI